MRREKLETLKEKGKNPFEITHFDGVVSSEYIKENFEHLEGTPVRVAGRIISKRIMGKASFFHIQDGAGRIQGYARKDVMGEEPYAEYKTYDIGDIVGLDGEAFRTNAGEISVKCHSVMLLAKSLLPLPEKFHGLKDMDLRYRQRYVDLIVNPEVRDTFIKRSKIIKAIRDYLDDKGFMEVETPILHGTAGGAAARPFITHHNTLNIDMYLRIATELHLKRLIVGGFEKVYELGRIFRNEGMDIKHNPEFYNDRAVSGLYGLQRHDGALRGPFCPLRTGSAWEHKDRLSGQEVDLTPPWNRISMNEAVKQYTGVDFAAASDEQARELAKKLGLEVKDETMGKLLSMAFDAFVEDKLVQPTFVVDYPVEISPLAKRKADDPRFTERFELFITAREFCNAFSELNDPMDQKQRFLQQLKEREAGDEEAHMMDEDFINALEYGMPQRAELALESIAW